MNEKKNKLSIHWKILIGILFGLLTGILATKLDNGLHLVQNFVKPFGTIFIKILKLIAVPLVFISLAKGIVDLKDIKKLSALGGKTILWYMMTTVFAVVLGLFLINVFKPGSGMNLEAFSQLSTDTID